MIFHSKTEEWISVHYTDKTKPVKRCRQGSKIEVKDENTAELSIFGGHTGQKILKDVWKAKIIKEKSRFKIEWQQLEDMCSPTHRCFIFSLGESTFLVGGFKRSMTKLLKVLGPSGDVSTYNLMNLPYSEKKTFDESKSLVGFGAVYDEIDQCLIAIGGGNVGQFGRGSSPKSHSLGDVDGQVFSKPRICYLHHNTSNDEWNWMTHEVKVRTLKSYVGKHLSKAKIDHF